MMLNERLARAKAQTARIWALTLPYFQSDEKWFARTLLAGIVALNLGMVYMLVLLNDWNRSFYDALQEKNQPAFWSELLRFCWIAAVYIAIAVYKFYMTQVLEMRWRRWLTSHYLQRWLAGSTFYQLELAGSAQIGGLLPDNPDQRIQEDVNQFTGLTLSLSIGVLNASVTLISFVGILWGLSGSFAFELGGQNYTIPGFMVWMAVLYCAGGSLVAHWIGYRLSPLNFRQQKLEADFRHHMMRVREYSESIALDRGGGVERIHLDTRFGRVLSNYWQLLRTQKNLLWFTTGFAQVASVFPLVIAAPRFFSGAIQLGELMQIASAFGRVQDSLSWLVENYDRLAIWSATAERLTSFEACLTRMEEAQGRNVFAESQTDELLLSGLDLSVPVTDGNSHSLIRAESLALTPGDKVLLRGPSGSGKSTLFRALGGLWPWRQGNISVPSGFAARSMFIPQRPYLPQGSLREALTYPEPAQSYKDGELKQALNDALLPDLVSSLDAEAAWNLRLSGGEQQRLAVARVLLKKPRWLFADEATSALDEQTESLIYQKLLETIQANDGTMVSISHRPGMQKLHNKIWQVSTNADGPAIATEIVQESPA